MGDDEGDMFVLRGEYDSGTQEFRWVQTYVSGVALFYRGFCDAATLWGTWHDTAERHGGFRIWPLAVAAASPTGRATDCSRAGSSNSRQSG